jgi:dihydroneopterin aldolase
MRPGRTGGVDRHEEPKRNGSGPVEQATADADVVCSQARRTRPLDGSGEREGVAMRKAMKWFEGAPEGGATGVEVEPDWPPGAITSMTVFVRALSLTVVIGVSAHERRAPTRILADLEIGLAGFHSATSDAVADTVDYAVVAQAMKELVAGRSYRLLERLAQEMASALLAGFDARWARVRVAKTGVVEDVETTGVELTMHRVPGGVDR